MRLNVFSLILIAVFLVIFAVGASQLPWTSFRIAGVAIALPSFILLVVARLQLGRAFSVQAKATELVTTGLYSRIRNPIYVFGALMIAGFIVWTGRPLLLLVFLILIPLQIYRSRKEAAILEQKFGSAYIEYRKQTWF